MTDADAIPAVLTREQAESHARTVMAALSAETANLGVSAEWESASDDSWGMRPDEDTDRIFVSLITTGFRPRNGYLGRVKLRYSGLSGRKVTVYEPDKGFDYPKVAGRIVAGWEAERQREECWREAGRRQRAADDLADSIREDFDAIGRVWGVDVERVGSEPRFTLKMFGLTEVECRALLGYIRDNATKEGMGRP